MNTITLKVKEGPGELIGITQIQSDSNEIIFDKIQLSEPGQYVISVINSQNTIENTEFSINVLPQEDFIEQPTNTTQEAKKILDGNRPVITQIDPPSISLPPMLMDVTSNDVDNSRILEALGKNPFFWYNGIQIPENYISKLELYYEDMIPKAKITFLDAFGLINSPETMPLNDTRFEIFLNSGSTLLKYIHLKFKLEVNQLNRNKTNTITGILDIPNFYKVDFRSYKSNSFDTIREVCKEHNLGFNSNITQTNDEMSWIKNGKTSKDFIKNILNHAYISDDSFVQGYIDFYYSFNYVDLEKEWKRDNSKDVGINSIGMSSVFSSNDLERITPMILVSDRSLNMSGFGFKENYKLNNNSTRKNSKKGVYSKVRYYDRSSKTFYDYDIDSINSDEKDMIILKGAPYDKSELDNYRSNYNGKIDIDNIHQNYLYAHEHNKRNLNNLTNITIEIELYELNFNLYKFQKIKLVFINDVKTITNPSLIDERLTGNWMIIDILFIFSKGVNKQKIVLARKELGKLKDEIENQNIQDNNSVNNSEINTNPSDDSTILNNQTTGVLSTNEEFSSDSKLLSESDITNFARIYGLEVAVVKAVIDVESSGNGFYPNGKPKIKFEGHVFWKNLKDENINPESLSNQSTEDILFPKWTRQYYRKAEKEYERLEKAIQLGKSNKKIEKAALSAASWGAFQVLGSNAKSLGYSSIEEFVEKMELHEKEHLDAFGRFIKKNRLLNYLKNKEWAKFAKGYNGPQYAINRYDQKLQEAYLKNLRS
jgi:hypothetical protein